MIIASRLECPDTTRALLWDLDGVLIDSLGLDLKVCNELLQKYFGGGVILPREFIRKVFPYDVPTFWRLILDEASSRYAIKPTESQYLQIVKEYGGLRATTKFELNPGIREILDETRKLMMPMAVVSNNPTDDVRGILSNVGIESYFDVVVGNDVVVDKPLRKKPAPDTYIYAANQLKVPPGECVVIEDSPLGVAAGKAAGCFVVGVATGSASSDQLAKEKIPPDKIYDCFIGAGTAPSSRQSLLFNISTLAKMDLPRAQIEIVAYMQSQFPELNIVKARINSSKVSLNSVNGYITDKDGKEYFFKFHTEEGEKKTLAQGEYYNASILSSVGLPVIMPLASSGTPGAQCVIYEKIAAPTAFDLIEKEDVRFEGTGRYSKSKLLTAERRLLEKQFKAYEASLALSPADEIGNAPINQLFYTRLAGRNNETPRLQLFYEGKSLTLPDGEELGFDELAEMRWTVNGVKYNETLKEIIENAKKLLDPFRAAFVPTVIGHGDCHNGNAFLIGNDFYLFDPAFAGRQPALLSFVKATAHNVYLHPFWLYDPAALEGKLKLWWHIKNGRITINHNWNLAARAPIRMELRQLQIDCVWKPLISLLAQKNMLPSYWKEYLRAALFCCPFLVMNLIDARKFTPEVSLLALSMCMDLGGTSKTPTRIDDFLNAITPADL